jgi:hypothetical protein
MKKLDTLIEDIYGMLDGLSHGKPLGINEKELDVTLANIKQSILEWSNPSERNKTFTLRMSNIGRPVRQLWYESRAGEANHVPKASDQIKFLYGHILEEIVLMLARTAGHAVTDQQKDAEVKGITGHMDAKIDGEVVDVKTASRFAFAKFQNGALFNDDPFGYLAQLSAYETSEGTSNGGFLVINKESGELCLYRPVDLEKPNVAEKIKDIKKALSVDEPPTRCYNPVADGKSGNMKLPKNCVFCPFKFECHSDANDFDGLRVFKYSSGPVYLTDVVNTPRVEEITNEFKKDEAY